MCAAASSSSNLGCLRIPVVDSGRRLLVGTGAGGDDTSLLRVLLEGVGLWLVASGEVILNQALALPGRNRRLLSLLGVHRAHDSALPALGDRVC